MANKIENLISSIVSTITFPFKTVAQARQELKRQQEIVESEIRQPSLETEAAIAQWAEDEKAKLDNDYGFEFSIRNHDQVAGIVPASTLEAGFHFLLGKEKGLPATIILLAFGGGYFNKMASLKCQQFMLALLGKTVTTETNGVQKDGIIIFPDNLSCLWQNVAEDGEDLEDIVRITVRHEIRHAEQISALRQEGGSLLVKKVQAFDALKPINNQLMEVDALAGERVGYPPISEFVEKALAAVAAH